MNAEMFVSILESGLASTLEMHNLSLDDVYLQMDNDPKHTSKLAQEWLERTNVDCLQWPSCSPDMNPIEHVWNHVDMRIRARSQQPRNMAELRIAIEEEWYSTPVEYIQNLYDSMQRRVDALYKAKGSFTKY